LVGINQIKVVIYSRKELHSCFRNGKLLRLLLELVRSNTFFLIHAKMMKHLLHLSLMG